MGELTSHAVMPFSNGLSLDSNPIHLAVVQPSNPRPADADPPVFDSLSPVKNESVVNDEKSQEIEVAMTPSVHINNQGPENLDDDDMPSDGEESEEGNELAADGKADSTDQISKATNGDDLQNILRDDRRSKRAESWARARFDAWRALDKKPITETIEDLCDRDMKELGEAVGLFLSQVRKQNGKEYPAET